MSDLLDRQLRDLLEAETTSVADAGFTRQVMSRVPRRCEYKWGRQVIIPGMTLVGGLLGLIVLPGGDVLTGLLERLPLGYVVQGLPLRWLIVVYALCWATVASLIDDPKSRSIEGADDLELPLHGEFPSRRP